MLESLNYSFRNPKNIIWVIYRIEQLRNYKKTMGSSEDPSLVNNFDELGLVYRGLNIVWMNFRLHTVTTIAVLKRIFFFKKNKGMFIFMEKPLS